MKHPPRVNIKNGRYYLIVPSTERDARGRKRRKWLPLSRVDAGPAALYDELARVHREQPDSSMPAIVSAWKHDVLPKYSYDTRVEYEAMCKKIAEAFEAFDVKDLRPKDIADLVDQWKDQPRTSNKYRSLVGLILRYAIRKGHRDANPVSELATYSVPERSRYLTDSEIARIKDKSSTMGACLIDLALVTGQRIGDLLALRWSNVTPEGVLFRPSKLKGSTGVAVPIRMTPRLAAVLARCKSATKISGLWVIRTVDGQPLTYSGAHSAWRRAIKAANKDVADDAQIRDAHFHDLRHRALTDAERQGKDARRLGGHASKAMTLRYIEAAGLDWIDPPEEAQR